MTREEFESILEEAFIEGYNNAYEEIEEILDEDYIDIEDDMDSYNEEQDGHPRTLRGTGIHMLPKGAYKAFKDSRKEYIKANNYADDINKYPRNSQIRREKFKKWKKQALKAIDVSDDYMNKHYDTKEAEQDRNRKIDNMIGKNPYKNNIARIMANRRINATEPQYSRIDFVGDKQ